MMMRMDAAHLAFKDNAFDCVLSGFLGWDDIFDFECDKFVGPRNKMEEIHRVLRKGGSLGISSWLFLEDTEWMGKSVYAYLRKSGGVEKAASLLYSKENEKGMRELLGSLGFIDITCFTEHYSKKFLNGEEYWEKMLSMGWQTHIGTLKLKPEEHVELKEHVMQRLENQRQSDGFYFATSVLYAFGAK
jgi:SAM-dependent methyltransferase